MDELPLVHRVCKYIRGIQALERNIEEYPCLQCPLTFEDERYGKCVQGCVLQAQELIALVNGKHQPKAEESKP